MALWTSKELAKVGAAGELDIQTMREDGTLRKPVIIWVVRVGDDLYVRAYKGPTGLWYRHAKERHAGRISSGGVAKDVTFVEVGDNDSLNDEMDAAYRSKYRRYGATYVGTMTSSEVRNTTLKLVPVA